MLVTAVVSDSQREPDEWADRSHYWLDAIHKHTPKRKRRERQSNPLILTGHGISISVDKGTLLVTDGNTHYPSERRTWRFFKGELATPTRILLIDGAGRISLDALDWLAEQRVLLLRLRWNGQLVSAIGADGYLHDRHKVAWQIATRADETHRIAFAVPLIIKKAKATLFNLRNLLPSSHSRDKAIDVARTAIRELKASPPSTVSELLAVEGWIAAGYFFAWRALQLKWKSETRHPIPDEWRRFFSRSALAKDVRKHNFGATHPVNAMLNYSYGILEGHIRISVFASGHDPAEGILHSSILPERHSFVFDLMEPLRPVVDRAVLKLIDQETYSGADFVLQADGVCRLNPELARRVAQEVDLLLCTAP